MRDNITTADSSNSTPGGSAARRVRRLKMGLIAAITLVVAAVIVTMLARRSLPLLTAEALAAAEARWTEANITAYEVEIAVSGAQPADYLVRVEDRDPIAATRNGRPLTQRRTWETWTVPGMFDTLASDVAATGARENLVVRCQFHPENGLPERYERIELGTGQQVSWLVKRFQPQQ